MKLENATASFCIKKRKKNQSETSIYIPDKCPKLSGYLIQSISEKWTAEIDLLAKQRLLQHLVPVLT